MKWILGMMLIASPAFAAKVTLPPAQKARVEAQIRASGNKYIAKLAGDDKFWGRPPERRLIGVAFGKDDQGKIFARGQVFGPKRTVATKRGSARVSSNEGWTILKVNPTGAPKTVLGWGILGPVSLDDRPGVVRFRNSPLRIQWAGTPIFVR